MTHLSKISSYAIISPWVQSKASVIQVQSKVSHEQLSEPYCIVLIFLFSNLIKLATIVYQYSLYTKACTGSSYCVTNGQIGSAIIISVSQMSCFTGCLNKSQHLQQNPFINRYTQLPMNFTPNERDELAKRFRKVSNNKEYITLQMFKKNMGILGLHCSQEFSERLFNAFDLDNDNRIGLQDFLEYMYILRGNNDALKARISFKMIVPPRQSIVTKDIFKKFLSDFFVSWSYVTSIDITTEIKERTNKYIDFLFKKVEKDTGKPEINLKYYVSNLYKDKDYMESFEFITQGMADIFIGEKSNDPEAVLYKVIKQIHEIKETVFQMSNEQSYLYEPVRIEQMPHYLPTFESPLFKKPKNNKTEHQKYRKDSDTKKSQYTNKKASFGDPSQTHTATKSNFLYEERKWESKELYQNSKITALQKKLKYIEENIERIVQETKNIYQIIKQKFDKKTEFKRTKDQGAAKNVHKRIKNAEGDMVFIGDENWNLVLNMMIGIQVAVRSSKGLQEIICEEPKDFRLKYCFELIPRRFGDEDYHSRVCSFTDYAPNTFNHIRKIFKIDSEDYINSIGPNKLMASLMMGEVSSMTSLTSQGKSGSFFYYTADGKYTLKTIQYRQYKFLRQILEDYYYYIKQNPDTLITKFFGLHKLIEKNQKGQEIGRSYFVIMANVFNTKEKITERYDIKGSWYGRETADTDPLATKKDNDFKKREPLYLSQEDRNKLLTAIKKDAKFFQEHEIIDYSLLIGVIKKSENFSQISDGRNDSKLIRDEEEQDVMRESKVYYGGTTGQNSQSYIFGIIDILTLYDSRKVLEYYFKRLVYGEGISAVPPDEYAQRFCNFIEKNVFVARGQKGNNGNGRSQVR